MKVRPVTVGDAEVSEKERDGKRKEQTRAETEARVKKRSYNVPFGEEKRAFPSRGDGDPRERGDMLSCRQAEEGCEGFRDAEQLEDDLTSRWSSRIAREPLLKAETIMRSLRTRAGER